eukprot:1457316-Amphidinium_carterae.1
MPPAIGAVLSGMLDNMCIVFASAVFSKPKPRSASARDRAGPLKHLLLRLHSAQGLCKEWGLPLYFSVYWRSPLPSSELQSKGTACGKPQAFAHFAMEMEQCGLSWSRHEWCHVQRYNPGHAVLSRGDDPRYGAARPAMATPCA